MMLPSHKSLCVSYHYNYIEHSQTGFFSKLVNDYIAQEDRLQEFISFTPDANGVEEAIAARSQYPVNRDVLVGALQSQYAGITLTEATERNLALLAQENTFTICTAHQPNLVTGYLYFIYKILHAIKAAQHLNALHPDKHFVPVYYMGSEDNDLEELGEFFFRGDRYSWDGNGQKGAVGSMQTTGLQALLQQLYKYLGPDGPNCDYLRNLLAEVYAPKNTIAQATRILVNALFGQWGLVILDPNDASLKGQFVSVIKDELLHQNALPLVGTAIAKLGKDYKIQAHPRAINLFYLKPDLRERIERVGDNWQVLNTDISWSEDALMAEVQAHPERFSPNVILRGVFQETVLPNVMFIGGGAEVAYWLQLRPVFQHYGVFYPVVMLRQSVMWMAEKHTQLQQELQLSEVDLFLDNITLTNKVLHHVTAHKLDVDQEVQELNAVMERLQAKATLIDATLHKSAGAAIAKMHHQVAIVKKKMLKAEKLKWQVLTQRVDALKAALFPKDSLQERKENFLEYYLTYGVDFFDVVLEGIQPFESQFLVVICEEDEASSH